MAVGDVTVTVVESPTTAEIDTALTAIRVSIGANGSIGACSLDSRVFCWGVVEA